MSSPLDDLARVLLESTEDHAPAARAVPGFVTTWDPVTGANTVSVGAMSYTGLPAVRSAVTGIGPCIILFTPSPVILGTVSSPTA
jgi:hypothetical protein